MIKYLAIFFLLVYALGATPIGQICKLPALVEHFQQHETEKKDLSILSFLKMHYFNGDPIDADHEEDMKLPFKTTSSDFGASQWVSSFTVFIMPQLLTDYEESMSFTPKSLVLFSSYLSAVWQPPRFV